MQIALVVDIGERVHAHVPDKIEECSDRKHAMGIEFDALRADRHGEIELAALGQHALQIGETFQMALEIDGVAVAAEAEMFERMQARHRIAIALQRGRERRHHIDLLEAHVWNVGGKRPHVEHFDLAIGRDMGHEPVDARTHIHMQPRRIRENPARHKQVLMEIVALCGARIVGTIVEAGIKFAEGKRDRRRFLLALQLAIIAHELRNLARLLQHFPQAPHHRSA